MEWARWFGEIGIGDVPLVGSKNASLGEMLRAVGPLGIRVPDGYAVTADGYRLARSTIAVAFIFVLATPPVVRHASADQ